MNSTSTSTSTSTSGTHSPCRSNNKCAVISLVFGGDRYTPGAIVLAASYKASGGQYPAICMVDASVSPEARQALGVYFDDVVEVPILERKTVPMRSAKQNKIYGGWINRSFTKWNALDPILFGAFDKVLFLDADIMIIRNIDELFDLPAPAATFSSPWAAPYVGRVGAASGAPRGIFNPYGDLPHGARVPRSAVIKGFTSILGIGSVVLLEPSRRAWETFQSILAQSGPYGNRSCYSGADEQILADIFTRMGLPMYHIHPKFNWFVGKYDWLTYSDKEATPYLYHYYNIKCWEQPRDAWADTIEWWKCADEIVGRHPDLARWFVITPRNE